MIYSQAISRFILLCIRNPTNRNLSIIKAPLLEFVMMEETIFETLFVMAAAEQPPGGLQWEAERLNNPDSV